MLAHDELQRIDRLVDNRRAEEPLNGRTLRSRRAA